MKTGDNYTKANGRWQRTPWRTLDALAQFQHQERYRVDANGFQLDSLSIRTRGRGLRNDTCDNSLVFPPARAA